METYYIKNIKQVKEDKKELEKKLNVKINIVGRKLTFEGEALDEYVASQVFEAIEFGFSPKKALVLIEPDMSFRKVNMKQISDRTLKDIKSRIIGSEGKTKRTIEHISGCEVVVGENTVGIIGHSSSIEAATTSIKNVIRGTKQANAYRYLERLNTEAKKFPEDLGLKKEK